MNTAKFMNMQGFISYSCKILILQTFVNAAPISGNLDSPEGGFDAIMQAIACKVRLLYLIESF